MIIELSAMVRGGYSYCLAEKLDGKLKYISHTKGSAKKSWVSAIKQINNGDKNPSYDAPWGDSFPVVVK